MFGYNCSIVFYIDKQKYNPCVRLAVFFTLTFGLHPQAQPSDARVYGLNFEPCPVWKIGGEWVVVPDNTNPRYAMGHLRHLLNQANFDADSVDSNKVQVLCHEGGHGLPEDLKLLEEDLKSEGFEPQIIPQ